MSAACRLCGACALRAIPLYGRLRRVSSDCRPWSPGGRLAACARCGCLQAPKTGLWRRECARIYRSYSIYHQSAGAEQVVYTGEDGGATPRSEALLERVLSAAPLAAAGRLLDVGCGNGALLRAFKKLRPRWSLFGSDLHSGHRGAVEKIAGPGSFYSGDPLSVRGSFELISLVHVLEHMAEPTRFLEGIREKLSPGGLLLVHVPCYERNPFELLIADHATHFSRASLRLCMARAGFKAVAGGEWVPKERTLLARPSASKPSARGASEWSRAERTVRWLFKLKAAAARAAAAAAPRRFGIFGTSIAGTWLAGELRGRAGFFVDEDPYRRGRRHEGLPILHPEEVGEDRRIFVALPPRIAARIRRRLSGRGAEYLAPPKF